MPDISKQKAEGAATPSACAGRLDSMLCSAPQIDFTSSTSGKNALADVLFGCWLLKCPMWEVEDAGFLAGVIVGWPGLDDEQRTWLLHRCPMEVRIRVRQLMPDVIPNPDGAGALFDEIIFRAGGGGLV